MSYYQKREKKQFVAVIQRGTDYSSKKMYTFNDEESVLNYIGSELEGSEQVVRVFSFNDEGKVEHYEIKFEGRLKLVVKQEEIKTVFDK